MVATGLATAAVVVIVLTKNAYPGDPRISVSSTEGTYIGQCLQIGNSSSAEFRIITDYGSIVLDEPLALFHEAGTVIGVHSGVSSQPPSRMQVLEMADKMMEKQAEMLEQQRGMVTQPHDVRQAQDVQLEMPKKEKEDHEAGTVVGVCNPPQTSSGDDNAHLIGNHAKLTLTGSVVSKTAEVAKAKAANVISVIDRNRPFETVRRPEDFVSPPPTPLEVTPIPRAPLFLPMKGGDIDAPLIGGARDSKHNDEYTSAYATAGNVAIPADNRVIFACHGEILLNFVPEYLLRPLFKACWNRCYPDAPWKNNAESGDDFVCGALFDHFLGTGSVSDDLLDIDQSTADALKEHIEHNKKLNVTNIRVRLISSAGVKLTACWIYATDDVHRWKVDLDAHSKQTLQQSIRWINYHNLTFIRTPTLQPT